MLKLFIAVDGSAHAQRAIEATARLQPQSLGLDVVHGRGALGGLLLGSVAQRVVHLATVPVLLVK